MSQEKLVFLSDQEYLVKIRRHFHQHPEVSLQEYETAKYIRNELEAFQIPYIKVGETGTLGILEGKEDNGKKLFLRADIDALPIQEENEIPYKSLTQGVMHACGHDLHTAALLGAAKYLSGNKDKFSGKIYFAFQQAEEFGHGSHFFIEEGYAKGYDRAFGMHIDPACPVGKIEIYPGVDAASCDYFKITVEGKSSHISKPHQGKNSLLAATEIVQNLYKIKGSSLNPTEEAVIGVGKLVSGTSYNVIAQDAVIEGTIRATSEEMRDIIKDKIQTVANITASLYETEVKVEFEGFTRALINDQDVFEEFRDIAVDYLGEENVITNRRLIMGFAGDDFAEISQFTKHLYAHIGVANEHPNTQHPLHHPSLDIDERAIGIASDLHIRYALWYLKSEK